MCRPASVGFASFTAQADLPVLPFPRNFSELLRCWLLVGAPPKRQEKSPQATYYDAASVQRSTFRAIPVPKSHKGILCFDSQIQSKSHFGVIFLQFDQVQKAICIFRYLPHSVSHTTSSSQHGVGRDRLADYQPAIRTHTWESIDCCIY